MAAARAWVKRKKKKKKKMNTGAEALALPPPLTFTPALLPLARSHPAERAILPTTHAHQRMDKKREPKDTEKKK